MAGRVLIVDADQLRRASGKTVVRAVNYEAIDIHTLNALHYENGGNRIAARCAGRVLRHAAGNNDDAVVSTKRERRADGYLLGVGTGANANHVAGSRGIHGGLNRGELRG